MLAWSAKLALVVSEHDRALQLVREGVELVMAEHGLDQREDLGKESGPPLQETLPRFGSNFEIQAVPSHEIFPKPREIVERAPSAQISSKFRANWQPPKFREKIRETLARGNQWCR